MTTKTATELFAQLSTNAKLTNDVSAKALTKAKLIWTRYTVKPNGVRDLNAPREVLAQLDIILRQIAHKNTKINPTQWRPFCTLHCMIADAVRTGTILEPLIDPANDDESKGAA